MRLSRLYGALAGYVPGIMDTKKEASVLLPLIESAGEIHIFYEKRAKGIVQGSEVCFPGGILEKGESPKSCALREFTEETGIPEDFIKIIGEFDTQFTYGGFYVHTFLAELDAKALSIARPNPSEVEKFFTVPLSFFIENKPKIYEFPLKVEDKDDGFYEYLGFPEKSYSWAPSVLSIPIWKYGGEAIWGMTGRITKRLVGFIEENPL